MKTKKSVRPPGERCGLCKHWHQIPNGRGDQAMGDCYGGPPVVIGVDNEGGVLQARPRLAASEQACAVFQPHLNG